MRRSFRSRSGWGCRRSRKTKAERPAAERTRRPAIVAACDTPYAATVSARRKLRMNTVNATKPPQSIGARRSSFAISRMRRWARAGPTRPTRTSTVLPRTYAWVIQLACSGSAWRLAATCRSPMITMRESTPPMSTPTVVTVRTVHLYWIRIAFHRPTRGDVRSPRGPGRRATKPQEYLNLPNHSTRKRGDPRNLRDADTLDRMMAGDQVPRYPDVSTFLSDRATLLRGLHGHGRMDDVPTLLELDALHVEVPEDVRDEPVRLVRVLDHVDVLVHEPLQLRDVLALLPDRLADVPFLHDENQLVGCVDAVDDGRPREILEESDVFDRLFVK